MFCGKQFDSKLIIVHFRGFLVIPRLSNVLLKRVREHANRSITTKAHRYMYTYDAHLMQWCVHVQILET